MVDSIPNQQHEPVKASSDGTPVLAVIVTYNPDIAALENAVVALLQQRCSVLLVDNASENQTLVREKVDGLIGLDLERNSCGLNLIVNSQNRGLGAAHNQGYAYAKEQGHDFLLILDQDSLPMPELVERLWGAHSSLSKHNKVSAVGACYLNAENQSESFFVRFGAFKFKREYARREYVPADFLISSGSLFDLATLDDVGGMDEALFIDHVDTEWFLRARSQGYQAFGVSSARMQHALGETTHQIKLGGRERNVPQHKPFRYYYIFRNSVALYKRGYTSWLWKWNDCQRLLMIFIMFGLLTAPRWENSKMMGLGFWHGLRGRLGPLN